MRMVVNELRGEKIDIVPYSEDPKDFVMKALSPAKVNEVIVDEEAGSAVVIVPDYQLSLAIGKEGQNARLAARMTGWRIDIKSETQVAEEAAYDEVDWAEGEWIVDEETGEQVWKPAEGGPEISLDEWNEGSVTEEEISDQEDVAEDALSSEDSGSLEEAVEEEAVEEEAVEEEAVEEEAEEQN